MIRRALKADFPAIAELQIVSWRSAYDDVLPQSYLGQPVRDDLTSQWELRVPDADDILLLHESEKGLTGFINVLAQVPPYVDNFHVAPDCKGRGIGSELLRAAASLLVAQGHTTVWLTVVETNLPAICFYEARGAVQGTPRKECLFGNPVVAVPMIWNDLDLLVQEWRT